MGCALALAGRIRAHEKLPHCQNCLKAACHNPFCSIRSRWVVERSWDHNQTLGAGGLRSQQILVGWESDCGKEGPARGIIPWAALAHRGTPASSLGAAMQCWGLYLWDCQGFYLRYVRQQLTKLHKIFHKKSRTQHTCSSSSFLSSKPGLAPSLGVGNSRSQCHFSPLQSVNLQHVMMFAAELPKILLSFALLRAELAPLLQLTFHWCCTNV